MKLLHISTEKHWRGGEQQIAYLIETLSKSNIENFLLCRKGSEMMKYAEKKRIPYKAISIRNSIDIFAIVKTAILFRRIKADFVHLHASKSHSIGLFAQIISGTQNFILHRRVSFKIKKTLINRWKYNHKTVKRIICISQDVKKQVSEIVKNPEKISVIYSGIDISRFTGLSNSESIKKEFNIPEQNAIVTGVGALTSEKCFETFLKTAAATLGEFKEVHFLIVGKGKEEEKLKVITKSLNIENKITFVGFRNDVPRILQYSDVFMLCSSSEGLGTSFIDAAAAGCALLGTNAGGIPEIIDNGENGYVENIGDYMALSKRLQEILRNRSLLNQMGEKAKRKAEMFSIKKMTESYLSLYKELKRNV